MSTMLESYRNLPEKDQRALKVLTAVLVPLAVYFLLLKPGFDYYSNAKQQYADNQSLLAWIKESAQAVKIAPNNNTIKTDVPLLQLISTSADAINLELSRIQPEGGSRVRVWLNEAEFKQLLEWLSELQLSGMSVSTLSVDKTSKPGVVNAQCLLEKQI